jgi:hypothetical protein
MRLTLWYCGMPGMALVLFGVVLYFRAHYFLLTPIETDVVNWVKSARINPFLLVCIPNRYSALLVSFLKCGSPL